MMLRKLVSAYILHMDKVPFFGNCTHLQVRARASVSSVISATPVMPKITPTVVRTAHHAGNCCLKTSSPVLDSFPLSEEEAVFYLSHVLSIQSVEKKLQHDRIRLLREIVRNTHYNVPYQNVTNSMLSAPRKGHIPSFQEIKDAMFTRQGGICYELNIFTNRLLAVLGYDVILASGTAFGMDSGHVTNIVRDLEFKGQRLLVEVGAYDPTFEPIPLNFTTESPSYHHSFLTFKFVRNNDGNVWRLHSVRSHNPMSSGEGNGSDPDKIWRRRTKIDPHTARDVTLFHDTMSKFFNVCPRPKDKNIFQLFVSLYANGRATCFVNNQCYVEVDVNKAMHHVTASPEELLGAFKTYLPMIPQDCLADRIRNAQINFPKKGAVKIIDIN